MGQEILVQVYSHRRLPQQHTAGVQQVARDVVQQPREQHEQRLVGRVDDKYVPHGQRGGQRMTHLLYLC